MTATEITSKMGVVHVELQNLEVRIQHTQADLDKAIVTEVTTKEGLEVAKKRRKDCKDKDLVNRDEYLATCKDVNTLENFLEQAKSHKSVIQAALLSVKKMQKLYQDSYGALAKQLAKAEANVSGLHGSQ